ncbi:hypothetical protein [Clostridium sp. UBA6640]|uniref:hypothetical protein n=1 Tax=Clostridium sp. UBA6640 TaxID=1946370 RepID=UPI0025C5972E|nr:hypothetical protein [Clostridium sp. UBA6640]
MFFVGVLFIILSIITLLLSISKENKMLIIIAIILIFICNHISLLCFSDNRNQLNSVNKEDINSIMGHFPIPQLNSFGYTITSVKFNSKDSEYPMMEVHYKSTDNELQLFISSKDEMESTGERLNLKGFKEIYLLSEDINSNESHYTFNTINTDDENLLYIFISNKNDKNHILSIIESFDNY